MRKPPRHRHDRPLVACCACQRVQLGIGQFVRDDARLAGAGDNVSHTYCPSCANTLLGISLFAYYSAYPNPALPLEFDRACEPADAA